MTDAIGKSTDPQAGKRAEPLLVAVDTGGTFTDLLMLADGKLRSLKVPSTPPDPSRAVLDGLRALGLGGNPSDGRRTGGRPFVLLHGTTVATNALLERKGARVGLVTNRGFEDVLEIGRQNRPQLYALVGWRKPPLASREDRLGVAGRLDPQGAELAPIDPEELAGLAAWAAERDSVAVCLLHSYANPAHEEAVAAALEGSGVPVSVSSRLLPEFREYERTSTTVVNAFVAPLVSGYLARLEERAGAARGRDHGFQRGDGAREAGGAGAGPHRAVGAGRGRGGSASLGTGRRLRPGGHLRHGGHLHRRVAVPRTAAAHWGVRDRRAAGGGPRARHPHGGCRGRQHRPAGCRGAPSRWDRRAQARRRGPCATAEEGDPSP